MTVPCPTCDRSFDTNRAMSLHHTQMHDDWPERFWAFVEDGDENECWEWTLSTTDLGYGQFSLRGEMVHTHRIAYTLEHGDPENSVLHHCDNRACCNPAHLYDGTQADNLADARDRDRVSHGETHHKSKLTGDDVRAIRNAYAEGDVTYADLADEYPVTESAVGQIVRGENWARR